MTRDMLKRRYEGIDTNITRGMLSAESKVHPYRTYEYDSYPELDEAGYRLRYWRVRYSDTKNNSTSHKALTQQTHFKGITLHLSARIIAWSPAPAEIE